MCLSEKDLDWLGDDYCDDGTDYPLNFSCEEWDFDMGDCDDQILSASDRRNAHFHSAEKRGEERRGRLNDLNDADAD